jgi:hypothetical protein
MMQDEIFQICALFGRDILQRGSKVRKLQFRKEIRDSYVGVSSTFGDHISGQKGVFVAMLIERCIYMPKRVPLR